MSPRALVVLLISTTFIQFIRTTHGAAASDFDPLTGPDGLNAYITKTGAQIRVYRELAAADKGKGNKTGEITVYVDALEELQSNGQAVQNHKIVSSSSVFTGNVSNDYQLQFSQPPASVTADCINCYTSLSVASSLSTMQLSVCAVKKNGTLVLDGESSTVKAGQLKFGFKLSSWPWDSTGDHLDVDIVVKVPPGRAINSTTKQTGKPAKFSLGDGAYTEFSTKLYVDGAWRTMAEGYPKMAVKGANNVVTLRIPRFNTSVIYDPTVEPGTSYYSGTSDAAAIASSIMLIGVMFILILNMW